MAKLDYQINPVLMEGNVKRRVLTTWRSTCGGDSV